jgi:hypothetical protein
MQQLVMSELRRSPVDGIHAAPLDGEAYKEAARIKRAYDAASGVGLVEL